MNYTGKKLEMYDMMNIKDANNVRNNIINTTFIVSIVF